MTKDATLGLYGFEHTEFDLPEGWYKNKLHEKHRAPVTLTAQEVAALEQLLGEEHQHIAQVGVSQQSGHTTFFTKSNQEIQWLKDAEGKFTGARLRHDLKDTNDVRVLMKLFIANGHSIDLEHVQFVGTPQQQKALRAAWEAQLQTAGPLRDAWEAEAKKGGPRDPDSGRRASGSNGPKPNTGGPGQSGHEPETQGDLLLTLTRAHSALLEHFKENKKTMSPVEKKATMNKLNLADSVCCIVSGCKDESGISGKFTPAILMGLKKDLGDNRPGTNVPLSPNWESMAKRLNIHQGSTDAKPKTAGPTPTAPKNQAPPPPKTSGPQLTA